MTRRETQRVHSRLSMAVAAMFTVFVCSLMHTQKSVLDLFAIFHTCACFSLSHPFSCIRVNAYKTCEEGEPAEVLAEGGNTVQNEEETM